MFLFGVFVIWRNHWTNFFINEFGNTGTERNKRYRNKITQLEDICFEDK